MRLVFSSVTHFMYLKYDKIMHSCKILYELIAHTPSNMAIRIICLCFTLVAHCPKVLKIVGNFRYVYKSVKLIIAI